MAKSHRYARVFQQLAQLEAEPPNREKIQETLAAALACPDPRVITKACDAAVALQARECADALARAYARLHEAPAEDDPGCLAKEAIVRALAHLDCYAENVFLKALAHVQMEPTWGGKVDTAGGLRGQAGHALAKGGYVNIHFVLAALVVDPQPAARRMAILALAFTATESAELILRLKVHAGDSEPDIVPACLAALMEVNQARSFAFVRDWLESASEDIAEGAALALGESRHPEAFETLREAWERADGMFRERLCTPMALTRSKEAFDFLLTALREAPPAVAAKALEALAIFAPRPEHRALIERTAIKRREPFVTAAYREHFE